MKNATEKIWRHIERQESGYLFNLSDSIRITEEKYPLMLTPVSNSTMIIASDYSGQHKKATHEAYSFVITTENAMEAWLPLIKKFRSECLPDHRTMSFKKLNEPVRWRALPEFLLLASKLEANLITILVDRNVGSFVSGGANAIKDALPDCFPPNANNNTVEKMMRLSSFMAFIIAGLRREDQYSYWVSDHDEALDSHEKRESFSRLATYLTFGLTNWKQAKENIFTTTDSDQKPYWSEDLAAIADLAAGAYCHMNSILPSSFMNNPDVVNIRSNDVDDKRVHAICNWLSAYRSNFKHVLLRLERDDHGIVRTTAQHFIAQEDR